jgi:hypothetical protein
MNRRVSSQQTTADQEEWRQFDFSTVGAWQGDIEQREQGDCEQGDELP